MDDKDLRDEARTLGMAGPGSTEQHTLQILHREQALVQGVLAVDSFDDEEIIMETDMGGLTIRGEELHIKQLDLETGRFAVEGYINAVLYSSPRQRGGRPAKGRSFLARLLR